MNGQPRGHHPHAQNSLHLDRDFPAPAAAPQPPDVHEALSFERNGDLLPAVEATTVQVPGHPDVTVELRVLDGGHQVVLTVRDQTWVETLLDHDANAPCLPISQRHDDPVSGDLVYEARCTVTGHSPRGLRRQRKRAQETCASATGSIIVGAGTEKAVGLCVFGFNDDDELLWRSWRVLPGQNRLAHTVTTVWLSAFSSALRRAG